jgi:hypothetical protein
MSPYICMQLDDPYHARTPPALSIIMVDSNCYIFFLIETSLYLEENYFKCIILVDYIISVVFITREYFVSVLRIFIPVL